VFDTASQTFALGRFQMTRLCKGFVKVYQCDVDKKLVLGGTLREKLTVMAAKKMFYFQQQVIAEAVCSAASKNIRA